MEFQIDIEKIKVLNEFNEFIEIQFSDYRTELSKIDRTNNTQIINWIKEQYNVISNLIQYINDNFLKKLYNERLNYKLNLTNEYQRDLLVRLYNNSVNSSIVRVHNYLLEVLDLRYANLESIDLLGTDLPVNGILEKEHWNSIHSDYEWINFLIRNYIEVFPCETDNKETETTSAIKPVQKKIKWLGSPSQFGFIIDALVIGGYIERPTSSFKKDAEFYLNIFDLDTTIGTLEKELNFKGNSITPDNRKQFKIIKKDQLK